MFSAALVKITIPLLGIYLRDLKMYTHANTCKQILMAALLGLLPQTGKDKNDQLVSGHITVIHIMDYTIQQ